MKTLQALLASSTLKIAGKTQFLLIYDTEEGFNVSNAHEVTVQAVPKEDLQGNTVLVVSTCPLRFGLRRTPPSTRSSTS